MPRATRSSAVLSLIASKGTPRYIHGIGRSESHTAAASTGFNSWNAAPPNRCGTTTTTRWLPLQRVVNSGILLMSS